MATFAEIAQYALSLPETDEHLSRGHRHWRVKEKLFTWERPLTKTGLSQLGDAAPTGDILGVRVPDLDDKQAILEQDPSIFFTTPHFDGYPAVLVRLERITISQLKPVIAEAWLCRAPGSLAKEFLATRKEPGQSDGVTL